MIRCNRLILTSFLFAALAANVYAQPTVDNFTVQRLPSKGRDEARALTTKLKMTVRAHAQEHSRVSLDYPYEAYRKNGSDDIRYWLLAQHYDRSNVWDRPAETLYMLKLEGKEYVAGVGAFVSMLKAEPHCILEPDESDGHCSSIAENRETCHLFLFDPQTLAIQAVGEMPIERDNRSMPGQKKRSYWYYDVKHPNDPRQIEGWPRCDGVLAVAPAKVVPNALLITLSYIDSGAPITKHEDEYPPQFKSTSLLRFSTDGQGKLRVVQDDTCLGNPNTYASIAAARKALSTCQARQPSAAP